MVGMSETCEKRRCLTAKTMTIRSQREILQFAKRRWDGKVCTYHVGISDGLKSLA